MCIDGTSARGVVIVALYGADECRGGFVGWVAKDRDTALRVFAPESRNEREVAGQSMLN